VPRRIPDCGTINGAVNAVINLAGYSAIRVPSRLAHDNNPMPIAMAWLMQRRDSGERTRIALLERRGRLQMIRALESQATENAHYFFGFRAVPMSDKFLDFAERSASDNSERDLAAVRFAVLFDPRAY
jgi:hypothetical protein